MAVPAIELKPRGAVALFDSAIRLCARSSGVWALTLPGGAVVTWASLQLAEAVTRRGELLVPCALFTAAWLLRGVFMGAACHYLDELVVGATPPTTWRSLRAAFARLPSLLIASVYLPFFTLLSLACTAGLAFFFLSSHLVGYAATMTGKGHPLNLYGTCARMLGPARVNAPTVRWLFGVIVLVGLNLHVAANLLVYLGRKLAGLDLTYAQRFVSFDNGVWVTVVLALAFTLFEPLRAATGTLLLIDGRVRQEGLDLVAAVKQLPQRRKKKPAFVAVALLSALCAIAAPSPALAQEDLHDTEAASPNDSAWPEGRDEAPAVAQTRYAAETEEAEAAPVDEDPEYAAEPEGEPPVATDGAESSQPPPFDRLVAAADACRYEGDVRARLQGAQALGPAEQKALRRLADDVDLYTWTWRDCAVATDRLDAALPQVEQSVDAAQNADPEAAAERAKEILARPEFVPLPDRVKGPDVPGSNAGVDDDPNSLSNRFERWWRAWMRKLFDRTSDPDFQAPPTLAPSSGEGAANFIVLLLLVAVVAVVVVVVFLAFRGKGDEGSEVEMESASVSKDAPDPMSALARPPEGWSSLADELAARGDFRGAVRSLYLALLSRLHGIGAIDYDPTLSNWDYCRQFRGHREWVPTFKDLTLRFDFVWYGHTEVSREGYGVFKKLTEPILAAPQVGPVPPGRAGGGEARA